jgi:hypothetical protein
LLKTFQLLLVIYSETCKNVVDENGV